MNQNFDWKEVKYEGRIKDGIGIIYLFDENMKEIGYHLGDKNVLTHTRYRKWEKESLEKLETNEFVFD